MRTPRTTSTPRATGTFLRGRKALLVAGSAAALLGTGTAVANAATLAPASHEHAAGAQQVTSPSSRTAGSCLWRAGDHADQLVAVRQRRDHREAGAREEDGPAVGRDRGGDLHAGVAADEHQLRHRRLAWPV